MIVGQENLGFQPLTSRTYAVLISLTGFARYSPNSMLKSFD